MQNFQPFTGTLGGRRCSNKIRSGKAFAVKTYYVGKHDSAPDEIKDLDDACSPEVWSASHHCPDFVSWNFRDHQGGAHVWVQCSQAFFHKVSLQENQN